MYRLITLAIALTTIATDTSAATNTDTRSYEAHAVTSSQNVSIASNVISNLNSNRTDKISITFGNMVNTTSGYLGSGTWAKYSIDEMTCYAPIRFRGTVFSGSTYIENAEIEIICNTWGKNDGGDWFKKTDGTPTRYANFDTSVYVNGVETNIKDMKITIPGELPDTTVTFNYVTRATTVGANAVVDQKQYSYKIPLFTKTGEKLTDSLTITVPDKLTMGSDNLVSIPIQFTGKVYGSNILNDLSAQRAKLSITQLDANLTLKLLGESGSGYTQIVPNNPIEVDFPPTGTRDLKIQVEEPGDYGTKTTQVRIDATIH